MPQLKKVHDTHVAATDQEAKQWLNANPSIELISMYPIPSGIKIWYWKFEEIDEMESQLIQLGFVRLSVVDSTKIMSHPSHKEYRLFKPSKTVDTVVEGKWTVIPINSVDPKKAKQFETVEDIKKFFNL